MAHDKSPSQLIDARIEELGDWRGEMLGRLRALVKEADPDVVEEWKWRGVPVWEHDGMLCTGETYKSVVKMTFAKGASLKDPAGLFNSSLEGNTRRAIDFHEGEEIDEKALKTLIRAAVDAEHVEVQALTAASDTTLAPHTAQTLHQTHVRDDDAHVRLHPAPTVELVAPGDAG